MEDYSSSNQSGARSQPRRLVAQLVIITATALALGHCLRQPTQMGANDISRWCTVWSLLERGTYVIDECPWQIDTQDKVLHESKTRGDAPPSKHFYSSKPALLPTLIAGILYPARWATGVPLDRVVLQERRERWTQKPDPTSPNRVKGVLETPKDPAKWPAYIFYFKPIIVLLNVIPYSIFLILFAAPARPSGSRRLDLVFLLDRRSVRHISCCLLPRRSTTIRLRLGVSFSRFMRSSASGTNGWFPAGDSQRPASLPRSPRRMNCPHSRCCRSSFACSPCAILARHLSISFRRQCFRLPLSWPLSTRSSASSSWLMSRSAATSISTKEVSGKRPSISTRSMTIPNRTRSTSST